MLIERLAALLLLTISFAQIGCQSHTAAVPRNSAVRWGCNFIAIVPSIDGNAAEIIRRDGSKSTERLLDALNDPGRFAAAHVLLTEIYGSHFVDDSEDHWNGMYRKAGLDDTVYNREDAAALSEKWKAYLQVSISKPY